MSRIYLNMTQMIGNTPLMDLERFTVNRGVSARILAKIERQNPSGSISDRTAFTIIKEAEYSRKLAPGGMIIEPASDGSGTSLAAVAAALGYRCVVVMPEDANRENALSPAAFGAEIVLTPPAEGKAGAEKMAEDLHCLIPGSIIIRCNGNEANPQTHYFSTGPEIWRECAGCLDIFVAGPGTEGMLEGAGRYLKEQNPSVKIIAAELKSEAQRTSIKTSTRAATAKGAKSAPPTAKKAICEETLVVPDDCAIDTMKVLAQTEGILCGKMSGAALYAAVLLAKRPEYKYKMIAVVLPDTGDRYLSFFG
ncbi:MAG: cysteine synthase family protein [Oscillospiraceae bacterium]|nr:cysteine synthase family protein [Oscillospiraceae bacterium]